MCGYRPQKFPFSTPVEDSTMRWSDTLELIHSEPQSEEFTEEESDDDYEEASEEDLLTFESLLNDTLALAKAKSALLAKQAQLQDMLPSLQADAALQDTNDQLIRLENLSANLLHVRVIVSLRLLPPPGLGEELIQTYAEYIGIQ